MSDRPRDASLEDVFDQWIDGMLDGIRVMMPGKVVSYDKVLQCVTVQPLIQDGELDPITGERVVKTISVLNDVPVSFYGAPRARITFPIKPGDLCMLQFSSSAVTRFFLGKGAVTDPGDDRRHDINDAVALFGLHTFGAVPTTAPDDAMVIHVDGIKLKLGGPTGTEPTLKATTFLSAMDTLIQAIGTAVGGIPGGTAAGTAITTAFNVFSASLLRASYKTASTEVK